MNNLGIYALVTDKYGLCPDNLLTDNELADLWAAHVGFCYWHTDSDVIADIITLVTGGDF